MTDAEKYLMLLNKITEVASCQEKDTDLGYIYGLHDWQISQRHEGVRISIEHNAKIKFAKELLSLL